MKTYRYIYYKLFVLFSKNKQYSDLPAFYAVLWFTFSICLNIMSIIIVLMLLFKKSEIDISFTSLLRNMYIVVFFIIFGIINYIFLATKNNHNKIYEKFRNESEIKKKKGNFLVILYLIISICLFPLFAIIYGAINM